MATYTNNAFLAVAFNFTDFVTIQRIFRKKEIPSSSFQFFAALDIYREVLDSVWKYSVRLWGVQSKIPKAQRNQSTSQNTEISLARFCFISFLFISHVLIFTILQTSGKWYPSTKLHSVRTKCHCIQSLLLYIVGLILISLVVFDFILTSKFKVIYYY
jgi:hypothetical protein